MDYPNRVPSLLLSFSPFQSLTRAFPFYPDGLAPTAHQENYLRVRPNNLRGSNPNLDWLRRVSKAAVSIAESDVISRVVNQYDGVRLPATARRARPERTVCARDA